MIRERESGCVCKRGGIKEEERGRWKVERFDNEQRVD